MNRVYIKTDAARRDMYARDGGHGRQPTREILPECAKNNFAALTVFLAHTSHMGG